MGGGFDFIGAFNNHEYYNDVLKQKVRGMDTCENCSSNPYCLERSRGYPCKDYKKGAVHDSDDKQQKQPISQKKYRRGGDGRW